MSGLPCYNWSRARQSACLGPLCEDGVWLYIYRVRVNPIYITLLVYPPLSSNTHVGFTMLQLEPRSSIGLFRPSVGTGTQQKGETVQTLTPGVHPPAQLRFNRRNGARVNLGLISG